MATAKKLDSIGLRISAENKDIIRLAAEFTGQDLTSYLVSTALAKAKQDIIEHSEVQDVLLSKRDFDRITDEVEVPSKMNPKLKKAFNSRAKKIMEQKIEKFIHISNLLELEKSDNTKYRKSFDCGEQSLNDYLQKYARKSSDGDISQTHILFDFENKKIISFYSTCNYSVQQETLTSKIDVPVRQVPATLIGRLAVDKSCAGQGYGALTLAQALMQIKGISKITGIKIVT